MTRFQTLTAEELLAQSDWLRSLARRLVHPDEADDLTQDTFAAALTSERPQRSPLRPWLATVARNLAANRHRSRQRRSTREQTVARPERIADTAEFVERAELLKRVVDLVLELPEPQPDFDEKR